MPIPPGISVKTDKDSDRDTDWMFALVLAIIAGVVVVAILCLCNATFGRFAAMASGLILTGAAALSGGFLGFLFGIPRAKQIDAKLPLSDTLSSREYLENTNLEQISDWLTKIIVGLTLVEFQKIQQFFQAVGTKFGPVLLTYSGDAAVPQAIAIAATLYFLLVGFLFSYLWTRVYMETVLRRQSALLTSELGQLLEDREAKVDAIDAQAIELVDAYLDKNADPNAEKFADLESKVASSSYIARTMIFDRARKVRKDNWRDGNKVLIGRAVPIFRGLIAAAPDSYHRNYGQLGYALIKKENPDWAEARKALEKAIQLRGPGNDSGSGYYEFNLANALIHLDQNFKNKAKSDAATRERIAKLLDEGRKVINPSDEPDVAKWAKLNDYPV